MTTDITLIPTGTWVVDPAHSRVGFAVKHLGTSTVRGEFKEFEGTLEIGEDVEFPLQARVTPPFVRCCPGG